MKTVYILFLSIITIGNIYSQNDKNQTKFEILFPEIKVENVNKKTITFYEFEEGPFTVSFSIHKFLDIPKNITTSEELCNWINEDIEDTIPDDFRFHVGHISKQIAYFKTTERTYSYEKETYLKLANEGYLFKYSVYGSGVKDKINSKYLKKYFNFLEGIKIN
ncbi:hypothetical protein [Ichthyenterobacterium magnum]|uniref:Uncharacterized protein n=1 Tax=Ichthyenterobacterium magnum TaxID=1230530 RepID=A0A420DLU4_9FLAO|nr:hypothetical protein [Ichthyenterobacterium magnum]RKE95212.1 hypothetical protein BXY80_1398 [Ichthyenterobacterium magnum]